MRLVFIGPPGAGKGSLAAKLGSLNLEHVSSGDFFRAEVTKGTSVGATFSEALRLGNFIPDQPTLAVMRKWFFARKDSRGFLLDGFPRNRLQASVLGDWLEARRETLAACILLELSPEDSLRRISERRVCPSDGLVYHLSHHPPTTSGVCDQCGTRLVQRSDDIEKTVRNRLGLFAEHTLPLVDFYRSQGLLLTFDASVGSSELQSAVMGKLASLR
jgi:adenylate kinase